MEKNRKIIAFLLILAINLTFNGCWSYTEMDERLIVGYVGIDYGKAVGDYRVTVRAVNAKPSQSGVEIIPEVITIEGKSVFETIRKLSTIFGRKLYWSHLKSIIISEKLASEDMLILTDFFYRDPEVRQDSTVYIASGASAEKLVELEASLQKSRDFILTYAIETQRFAGSFPQIDLFEFVKRSVDETVEPVLPIVNIYRDHEENIRIEGSAVFSGSKIAGKLNREESLMLLLIRNEISNPLAILPVASQEPSRLKPLITLEIYRSKSRVKGNESSGGMGVTIDVELDAGIGELNYPVDYLDEKAIEKMEALSSERIREFALKTIKKVQEDYRADIFGFGKAVEKQNPKLWNSIKDKWSDEFSRLSVDVNVKVNIMSTGKPSTPLKGR